MIPTEIYQRCLLGFLDPVRSYLDDTSVTEILVNGPDEVFVERRGVLSRSEARFPNPESLLSALRVMAQYAGRAFDEQHPILEARLPDGSRVEALLPPISPTGPSLAIRRFSKEQLTLPRLLELKALTPAACEVLRCFVECKLNIVVAGGTGSGKTSLLSALSALIPSHERVIVLEDARELQLQREHVLCLEARPPDPKGRYAITIRDLFKATLRLRPDRIILGEIRGGEALDLIAAMTSGHGGCMSTVHATWPRDTMNRLETLALLSGVELPLIALRAQLASAIDLIVQTARLRDGRRAITHITEVCGIGDDGSYRLRDLFLGEHVQDERHPGFELLPTGNAPECLPLLRSQGFELDASLFSR